MRLRLRRSIVWATSRVKHIGDQDVWPDAFLAQMKMPTRGSSVVAAGDLIESTHNTINIFVCVCVSVCTLHYSPLRSALKFWYTYHISHWYRIQDDSSGPCAICIMITLCLCVVRTQSPIMLRRDAVCACWYIYKYIYIDEGGILTSVLNDGWTKDETTTTRALAKRVSASAGVKRVFKKLHGAHSIEWIERIIMHAETAYTI